MEEARQYSVVSTQVARRLRLNATEAERVLWRCLRELKPGGSHFRRQVPIGPYVVDFACLRAKLIIEVDGGQHAENARDELRDAWFRSKGYRVLRFWNNDVIGNLDGVMHGVASALSPDDPHPNPPLKGEGI